MKILITCLFLLSSQLFSQTYLNIIYSDNSPVNSTDITQISKITISGSGMNFVLTSNTTVAKDLSTINRMTFGGTSLGDALPVELTSFLADSKGRVINLKWTTATEVNTIKFEVQRTSEVSPTNWLTVGTVNAHLNSSKPNDYVFSDNNPEAGKYSYRLKIVDKDGSYKLTEVINAEVALPGNFELKQNYPNPFNPCTVISYSLPFDCNVRMSVYDAVGRLVRDIVNENEKAGYHDFNFNARSLSSGIYFYSIIAVSNNGQKNFHSAKKLVLIK